MNTNIFNNIMALTDSYKVTQYLQYPPGTTKVYSYFESRGGFFPRTTFFGLQYQLKAYFEGVVVTREKIDEAYEIWGAHFGDYTLFNKAGWEYILENHGGRLPIEIRAVAEGSTVDVSNVLMTVENTDPECYWLTNYLETLLVQNWYPTTVATISRECKTAIKAWLEHTSGGSEGLEFKLHDFGFRGVSSVETAAIGGAAHLINFLGTDTAVALTMLRHAYNGSYADGFSIPASEHSTITSWGKEGEVKAFKNMLDKYPTGLVACVSDSWDIFNACENLWGTELRDQILSREGTLIVRPDSGDPSTVVLKCLDILGKKFGFTINSKGYKVLDPHVRIIQGDGVDYTEINHVLECMAVQGWSAENIAFGMGGGLLQKLNRDTQKFAFKCSHVVVDGKGMDVWKDPITGKGKVSKKGRLTLTRMGVPTRWETVRQETDPNRTAFLDFLRPVFRNGTLLVDHKLADIRERAQI